MENNKAKINYIRVWLSEMARYHKHRALNEMYPEMFKANEEYEEFMCIDSSEEGLHLMNAKAVADMLGIKVAHSLRHTSEYPHRYSFEFKGVTFFSIHENEL